MESPRRARALAACLVALLDGSLLLALLDADETKQELRREGLRAIAELILRAGGSASEPSRSEAILARARGRELPGRAARAAARARAGTCSPSTASRG